MNQFGNGWDPYEADCTQRGGLYNKSTKECNCQFGVNQDNGKCLTAEELQSLQQANAVIEKAAAQARSGGGGAQLVQESWLSKNRNILIGAAVIVGVIAVVHYAGN